MKHVATAERRVPVQARSRATVERLLDAAAALVEEGGIEAATTRKVAERADVSVGALYGFFADRDALLDALVMRHVAGFAGVMEQVFTTRRFRSWERAVDVVVDAYVDYYRSQPAFRALWFGRGLSPAALAADKANNSLLAEGATAFFAPLMPGARDLASAFDVALEIADAVLDLAFRDDPDGDPAVIGEAKVAVCAYLRTRLA